MILQYAHPWADISISEARLTSTRFSRERASLQTPHGIPSTFDRGLTEA